VYNENLMCAMEHPTASASGEVKTGSTRGSAGGSGGSTNGHSAGSSKASWQGKRLGRFRIQDLAGAGSMGKVFLAEDVNLKRRVALKVLPRKIDGKSLDPQKVELFIREARSAARLDHPSVMQVYEVAEHQGLHYIAMELVDGGNLDELVKAGGPLEVPQACGLCAEAAEALDYAHKMGVVHRDIKPSNLMLTRDGRCKITDFGLARLEDPTDTFRLPTEAVGTPKFAAPEVALGNPASPASDVYSLAASLWMLLTGEAIYSGKTTAEISRKHVDEPIPDIRQFRDDLPETLVADLKRALAKKPEDRFDSAGQFAKVLRRHTIGAGSATNLNTTGSFDAQSDGPARKAPSAAERIAAIAAQRRKKNLALLAIGGSVAAVAGILVALLLVLGGNDNQASKATADSPGRQASVGASLTPLADASPGDFDCLATDSDALHAAAGDNRLMTVRGTVRLAATSQTGKVFNIDFEGNDKGGFQCVFFPVLYPSMEKAFGGVNGSGLTGRTILVRGPVTLYKRLNIPQIIIESPSQIRALEEP
jgi:tRNA A-37 threonylcarbamoyl transferase component Bud32